MPVDPSAYLNLIPSSSFFRPPQPYNGQTPQWVIDQCKTNANIDFRNCENNALEAYSRVLTWCQLASFIPQVNLDGTVGTSNKGWITWLGGKVTVTAGISSTSGKVYAEICARKKQNTKDIKVNKCKNTRDEKCQRKV